MADSVLTEVQLIDAGVKHSDDRKSILSAFDQYMKLRTVIKKAVSLTELEPGSSTEEATAPVLDHSTSISTTECVVCMDMEVRDLKYYIISIKSCFIFIFQCEIIFVSCGHMCCCVNCSIPLTDCPMCRGVIERKIKVLLP